MARWDKVNTLNVASTSTFFETNEIEDTSGGWELDCGLWPRIGRPRSAQVSKYHLPTHHFLDMLDTHKDKTVGGHIMP